MQDTGKENIETNFKALERNGNKYNSQEFLRRRETIFKI